MGCSKLSNSLFVRWCVELKYK